MSATTNVSARRQWAPLESEDAGVVHHHGDVCFASGRVRYRQGTTVFRSCRPDRGFRALAIADEIAREDPGLEKATSIAANRAIRALARIAEECGPSEQVLSDGGPEFATEATPTTRERGSSRLGHSEVCARSAWEEGLA